jgi:hypothetical protein
MDLGTKLSCAVILLGNMVIATEWAKYGLLELSIMRPPNKKVSFALFCYVLVVGTSIIAHLATGWNPDLDWWVQFALVIPALVWIPFFRHVIYPSGLYEFNKAKTGTQHFALQFYSPGELDVEQAETLRGFGRAQNALALFDRAIEKQSKGTRVTYVDKTVTIGDDDVQYGRLWATCPACSARVDIRNESGRPISGTCHTCGAPLVARVEGDTLHLRAVVSGMPKALTAANKANLARIRIEKAWLLRMMGQIEEALGELAEAQKLNEASFGDDPHKSDCLSDKSMILFRRAEAQHAAGPLEEARENYRASLEIDRYQGDEGGIAATEALLSALP